MAKFLSKDQLVRLEETIIEVEKQTSGEIIVCLRKKVSGDIREAAEAFFANEGLDKTAQRNAVLILLAWGDKKLAVIGDEGIHEHVGSDFWEHVVGAMTPRFAEGDHIGGLEAGIREIGERLREAFPWQEDDVNELPDAIHQED